MSETHAASGQRRIVVTGMGAVTPLGIGVPAYWDSLVAGRSGISLIDLFDTRRLEVRIGGQIRGFDPERYMGRKEARRMDRNGQFAVAAALEARAHAALQITDANSARVGVLVGSGIGGIITTNEQFAVLFSRGPDRLSPFVVPMMLPNMASGHVSITLHARGPNLAPTSACSSGADAIGVGAELIRAGMADVIVAGGTEAPLCEMSLAGFHAARALSVRNDDPAGASRPFDATRDGFVMGEGAGLLVLESAEHALSRGAPILAELCGYGNVGDAYHITQPADDGDGGRRVMQMALQRAGIPPAEVGYVNAHGTSTPINDRLETLAIKRVFGDAAPRIPISSTKSMTGHLLGATAATEAIACVQAILTGWIPPTINLHTPDPACDLDYVPNQARHADVRVALTTALGFGGHNSCLVFRRWQD